MSRSASPPAAACRCAQEDVAFSGHAIECRINAEDPRTFVPSPGTITHFHTPGGLGIRVDSGVYSGYRIPPYYDSLIGKLIVHGRNRVECMMRLRRALDEFVVDGIKTTLPLFRDLVGNPDIANGDYDIHWLEKLSAPARTERRPTMTRPYAPGYRIPPDLLLKAYAVGRLPDGGKRRRPGGLLGAAGNARHHPARRFSRPEQPAKTIRQRPFEIRFDSDFAGVIDACAEERDGAADRPGSTRRSARPIRRCIALGHCPYGRGLAGRRTGRRPLRRDARAARSSAKACSRARPTPRRSAWSSGRAAAASAASCCSTRSSPPTT